MRAAVFKETGRPLSVENVPLPEPQAGELLLRVRACGICGSDLHATEHGRTPAGGILGHEFAGEVADPGPDAGVWKVGDRVFGLPWRSCGACPRCLADQSERCEHIESIGALAPGDRAGAYAEYIRVGAGDCIRLPEDLPFDHAALAEPLSTGLLAIREAHLKPGENVLIIGGGPIGLGIALWARFFGVARIALSERSEHRLRLAANWATDLIDANWEPDPVAAFTARTGRPPEVVFEAVGVRGMIARLIESAPQRCRLVVAGVCMEEDVFQPVDAILKEVTLRFILHYGRSDCQFAIDMMAAGRIQVAPLLSHHVSLDDLPHAFEALRTPTDQCKVVVTP